MKSPRDFVRDKLPQKLHNDILDFRIFNEADLQYRTAFHLDKEYFQNYWLRNQPRIQVGLTSGTQDVKPDIILFDHKGKPVIALELKCFIDSVNPSPEAIVEKVRHDIEKLKRFQKRHSESKYTFAIIVVRIEDRELHKEVRRAIEKIIRDEEWTKHYFFHHIINTCYTDDDRKRPRYNEWLEQWRIWEKDFSAL